MFNEALYMNKKTKMIRQTLLLSISMCLLGRRSPPVLQYWGHRDTCVGASDLKQISGKLNKLVALLFSGNFEEQVLAKTLALNFWAPKFKEYTCVTLSHPWSQPFVTIAPGEVCISKRLACSSRTERLWRTQLRSPELSCQHRAHRDRYGHCL